MNMDQLKLETEALSGGKRTILLDDKGLPSFMNIFSKMTNQQLFDGGSAITHPAFVVNGVEDPGFYFGSYQACVIGDRAYSLPLVDPKTSVNFDQAWTYCNNKGVDWHLASRPEWAAVSCLSFRNGVLPHGNSNYGADDAYSYEVGQAANYGTDGKVNRTLTGSGPATWSHDQSIGGVYDMKGNVWEWQSNLRLVNGEIQIMVGNMAASGVSHAASSTYWKSIMPNGDLVEPGTAGTIKISDTGKLSTTAGTSTGSFIFKNIAPDGTSVTAVPEILLSMMLAPITAHNTLESTNTLYVNNTIETLALAGGGFHYGAYAGLRYLNLINTRAGWSGNIGFRVACRKKA